MIKQSNIKAITQSVREELKASDPHRSNLLTSPCSPLLKSQKISFTEVIEEKDNEQRKETVEFDGAPRVMIKTSDKSEDLEKEMLAFNSKPQAKMEVSYIREKFGEKEGDLNFQRIIAQEFLNMSSIIKAGHNINIYLDTGCKALLEKDRPITTILKTVVKGVKLGFSFGKSSYIEWSAAAPANSAFRNLLSKGEDSYSNFIDIPTSTILSEADIPLEEPSIPIDQSGIIIISICYKKTGIDNSLKEGRLQIYMNAHGTGIEELKSYFDEKESVPQAAEALASHLNNNDSQSWFFFIWPKINELLALLRKEELKAYFSQKKTISPRIVVSRTLFNRMLNKSLSSKHSRTSSGESEKNINSSKERVIKLSPTLDPKFYSPAQQNSRYTQGKYGSLTEEEFDFLGKMNRYSSMSNINMRNSFAEERRRIASSNRLSSMNRGRFGEEILEENYTEELELLRKKFIELSKKIAQMELNEEDLQRQLFEQQRLNVKLRQKLSEKTNFIEKMKIHESFAQIVQEVFLNGYDDGEDPERLMDNILNSRDEQDLSNYAINPLDLEKADQMLFNSDSIDVNIENPVKKINMYEKILAEKDRAIEELTNNIKNQESRNLIVLTEEVDEIYLELREKETLSEDEKEFLHWREHPPEDCEFLKEIHRNQKIYEEQVAILDKKIFSFEEEKKERDIYLEQVKKALFEVGREMSTFEKKFYTKFDGAKMK